MTIFGWDLSHYDNPSIGDAVAEGFSFFTHKAGGDANDAEIGTWWNGVKNLAPSAALLGAYWVLRPDTAGTATAKADAFLARLDDTCKGWRDRPFMLQVDCEKWNNNSATVPSVAYIKAFCQRLVAKMPKLKPIVYGPQWVYGNNLAGLGFPLWASAYSSASSGTAYGIYQGIGGDTSSKWGAYSGQTPAVLQFTSSATIAGQTTCDANAYRGTLAELTALVAPGWEEEIDMSLTDDDKTDVATKTWQIDGLIANITTAGDIANNPYISGATALHRIYDLTQRTLAAVQALADPAAIAAAVVAALPIGATGDLTAQEVQDATEAGIRAVLGSLDNGPVTS